MEHIHYKTKLKQEQERYPLSSSSVTNLIHKN